jgi:hypothetical protein
LLAGVHFGARPEELCRHVAKSRKQIVAMSQHEKIHVLFCCFVAQTFAFFKNYSYLCNEIDSIDSNMDQNLALHQAQMGILRLLGRLKNVEQVNELRQIISNYYAQKATEEMDKLWETGQWNEETNAAVLEEHLRTPYKYAK